MKKYWGPFKNTDVVLENSSVGYNSLLKEDMVSSKKGVGSNVESKE